MAKLRQEPTPNPSLGLFPLHSEVKDKSRFPSARPLIQAFPVMFQVTTGKSLTAWKLPWQNSKAELNSTCYKSLLARDCSTCRFVWTSPFQLCLHLVMYKQRPEKSPDGAVVGASGTGLAHVSFPSLSSCEHNPVMAWFWDFLLSGVEHWAY